ncbi:DEAD/DEAH box helicase [Actinospica sp. MGRD01-02]|uniref:DEAD/DEAH box helicase n=1 Tax=Actinospica acidithermotolerans TaxID=2828514 RepID=A0A941IGP5_9ACTN|nr:DEAD/DEAH box helicase [Actinospica acidithermotolerans]MBR7826364.1 DEAD/DEAH box helicase [Actinospica acidithermotolerans]
MAAGRPARSSSSKPASTSPASAAPAATFAELGVPQALTDLLAADGITAPFPIQAATLPDSLAGRDVLGRGRTGSGKTLGFLLPVLTRLAADPRKRRPNRPRALVLAPTRELATQIHTAAEPLAKALGLRTTAIFGGVGARPQISALRSGLDLVIACPGRLLDHADAGHAQLDGIEITVLDEADHMADLGFLPMVKRILDATPQGTQRLLFSATLDNGIDHLVRRYLRDPVTHSVNSAHAEVPTMTHHVLHIEAEHRVPVLVELTSSPGRTIVFTRTKHGARKLAKQLLAARVPAVDLHGNLTQGARTRNLAAFASGQATTLVATDIAARGIHVDEVALVVHADPPVEHKAYLHRSGRTARAGNSGTVVTLMTDAQVAEVRELARKAKISATTTRLAPGDPLIATLAPGDRVPAEPGRIAELTGQPAGKPLDGSSSGDAAGTAGTAGTAGGSKPRRNRPRRPSGAKAAGTANGTGSTKAGSGKTGKPGKSAALANTGTAEAQGGSRGGRDGSRRGAPAAQGEAASRGQRAKQSAGARQPAGAASAEPKAAPARSGGAARASQNFRGRGR